MPRSHVWIRRDMHDGTRWHTRCGRVLHNSVASVLPEAATCIQCVRSARDRALWKAEMSSAEARSASERLEYLLRRKKR